MTQQHQAALMTANGAAKPLAAFLVGPEAATDFRGAVTCFTGRASLQRLCREWAARRGRAANQFLALALMAIALCAGSAAHARTVVFSANFDGTTVENYNITGGNNWGAAITKANLDAGTATGDWTVNQAVAAPSTGTTGTTTRIQTNGGLRAAGRP